VPGDASLHTETWGAAGEGDGSSLVLLHGFTQTARSWGRFGEALGAGRRVVAVDLPGHGDSGGVAANDLWDAAAQVAAAVDAVPGMGGTPYDLCGYSLGGRLALHVALASPERVGRLVLIGATPGIADGDDRARRRAVDEYWIRRLDEARDVGEFLEQWLAQPMFAGLPADGAQLDERQRNTTRGLASSLQTMGVGNQDPLWDRLPELEMPVLVVTGTADVRFTQVGFATRDALAHSVLASIPGAGHAAHLERPDLAARTVGHWLDTVGR
jgi:2-succinyl-6-hydroxy-2,4-cyclohexadiene-1-carboxylate synthase